MRSEIVCLNEFNELLAVETQSKRTAEPKRAQYKLKALTTVFRSVSSTSIISRFRNCRIVQLPSMCDRSINVT